MIDTNAKPQDPDAVSLASTDYTQTPLAPSDAADQPLLFDLPASDDTGSAIANSQPARSSRRAAAKGRKTGRPLKATIASSDPSQVEGATNAARIVFVDPSLVEPEPFNGRGLAAFDPGAAVNRELIDDMRQHGNTVPVRLRPKPDGTGWTCPSGSRRVNAARVVAADNPTFKVAAIVDEAMTDAEAYDLCRSDNKGRNKVTPMQHGREIKWAIENLHGGDRGAYIRERAIDRGVVSRALALVDLPEEILVCADDRETLPTVFAEKLAPRLKDKGGHKVILARAKALGGERLPSARLQKYLLTGERSAPPPDRRNIAFGTGRNRFKASVTFGPKGSAVFKVPPQTALSNEQCQELANFLKQHVEELVLGGDHG